ncbi:hypothetical protein [Streptomyces anulatus]|uniref:hypothetical protein n=1 Tax=Streptomyces anulatus TaxID=1892 RepID=UPI002E11329E|nr:hypothetical protein OG557_38640 [Streptomyces anulatus]
MAGPVADFVQGGRCGYCPPSECPQFPGKVSGGFFGCPQRYGRGRASGGESTECSLGPVRVGAEVPYRCGSRGKPGRVTVDVDADPDRGQCLRKSGAEGCPAGSGFVLESGCDPNVPYGGGKAAFGLCCGSGKVAEVPGPVLCLPGHALEPSAGGIGGLADTGDGPLRGAGSAGEAANFSLGKGSVPSEIAGVAGVGP